MQKLERVILASLAVHPGSVFCSPENYAKNPEDPYPQHLVCYEGELIKAIKPEDKKNWVIGVQTDTGKILLHNPECEVVKLPSPRARRMA